MATVLVADDDPAIRAVLTDLLTTEGYAVRFAKDGAAALADVLRARPDLVLSDVQMPRLDGLALAARLRPLGVPVVLMTARFFVGVPDLPFVGKPFDLAAVLDAVARALGSPVTEDAGQDAPIPRETESATRTNTNREGEGNGLDGRACAAPWRSEPPGGKGIPPVCPDLRRVAPCGCTRATPSRGGHR